MTSSSEGGMIQYPLELHVSPVAIFLIFFRQLLVDNCGTSMLHKYGYLMGWGELESATTTTKNGALHHAIHYWLGRDTSQDEAGAAAIKTIELDAALGGRAVQYREVQGHETEKFLSYFKPCIIPQEGGVASGFNHVEDEAHQTRLFECKGKHVVHVKEVSFARSSLSHDDIFILDTESKSFQFNGSNSSIQERAKALEVVQYVKYTYHDGKCEREIFITKCEKNQNDIIRSDLRDRDSEP
ncbi:villin-4-like [Primulina eburnea]|uniref:villin-4-like n=1 Tax=Primulina eburnea TaxID=1245227 RepID=UPI003C6C46F3